MSGSVSSGRKHCLPAGPVSSSSSWAGNLLENRKGVENGDFVIQNIYERTLRPVACWAACQFLKTRRGALKKVLFVGVTGSCGKTSTKELMFAVLSSKFQGVTNPGTMNGLFTVFRTICRAKPDHGFCLMEIGVSRQGRFEEVLRLFHPDIGVVLNVGTDHYVSFRGEEGVALEKGKLVEALKPEGTAILNADDPRVIAMTMKTRAKIFTFGLSPHAMLRAEDVRASFPEPLSFTAVFRDQRVAVRTSFFGAHFVSNVLAALATGIVAGIPLVEAAQAISGVAVPENRLNAVTDRKGVTFLMDAWKGSMSSLPSALDVIRDARAKRKWIVIGMLSDYPGAAGDRYRKVALQCLEIADGVVFVGPFAASAAKAKNPRGIPFSAFATVREARDFLESQSQPGDLVLLKSAVVQHLDRIALDRMQPAGCWVENCGLRISCSSCRRLRA